jgi:hypothetical protein
MHPMEYLRHVAGAQGADAGDLVHEAAWALGAMAADPQALVLIVRRLVDKHPTCAPLWWLGANVLTALDPVARAHELIEEYDRDPTEAYAREFLFGTDEPVIVVEALGCGVDGGHTEVLVVDDGSIDSHDPLVVVMRRGTVLPRDLWVEMKRRAIADDRERVVVVDLDRFDTVVGPSGVVARERSVLVPECASCPEMLVASGL